MAKKTESATVMVADLGTSSRVDAIQPNGRAAKVVKTDMPLTRKANRESKRESVVREDNY